MPTATKVKRALVPQVRAWRFISGNYILTTTHVDNLLTFVGLQNFTSDCPTHGHFPHPNEDLTPLTSCPLSMSIHHPGPDTALYHQDSLRFLPCSPPCCGFRTEFREKNFVNIPLQYKLIWVMNNIAYLFASYKKSNPHSF